MKRKKRISDFIWDLWCCLSLVGIWPRFIEPNLIKTNKLHLPIKKLPPSLKGLKILQLSDLHLNPGMTNYFIKKLIKKIRRLDPDIITFTGDFLCFSKFPDKKRLTDLLQSIPKARYGNYAIMGNHDYSKYAYVNENGDYDVFTKNDNRKSTIVKGFERLLTKPSITKNITPEAQNTPLNEELIHLLKTTPFLLLHNESKTITVGDDKLNICGLGEYMLGKMNPKEAFSNYDPTYPGIILVHNPDSIPHLKSYPGNIILCGHTHGGQINLPFLCNRFIVVENMDLKKGLIKYHDRWVYINRGLGGVLNFRWFCTPELLLLELVNEIDP
ncbi:MAG: UDP-2,3-diacylglucosamine diphosphatase LpxG [Chlamydiota bacterium]|nr:UDP-2,3-diacylglucosamine diphosphatase LpxG [Chlamydiota bacterium]